ncbi:GNAT family N-acetyltransferase [Jeotgalibaca sp. MA1X17-3]|uniref:GNAT family N-acetyltransferase n=1 Tax=Jeotgalibaca sp. MA1X17-3 TaxID=2908211 RepID=UPI001F2FDD6C|nr:GNAT family N-acetyltransferase [Jeotgalibaca sp. MA1X17-3]UJF16288.1 GNAT family N-acetyltransferase [Jeotgalibaca sp. MA1X17-3]
MNIRFIEKKDNFLVKELIQTSLEEVGLAIPGTAYFDPHIDTLYDYYATNKNANYWVIEKNHKIIGGVGIAPFSSDHKICELQKIYVASDFRGLGLSNTLMNTALEYASNYYEQCYLETHSSLEAACRLYEKYDFRLLDKPIDGSEHSAMDAWYVKDL